MNSNDPSTPLRNIDVALARAFVATAETGGMTAAARLLNLTQGAISQQIKRLEDLLQKSLFDRDHRQLTLTADGERLLLHARRLISLNDEIWGLMSAPDFEGTVRLGVPGDIIRPFMPPILKSFNDAWPKIRIDLVCKSSEIILGRLGRGEIDMALTTEPDTPEGSDRLFTDDLVWIGCSGGRVWRENPLPVAITTNKCAFQPTMMQVLKQAGRDWRAVGPQGSNDAMLAAIEADLAIGSLVRSSVPSHLAILGEKDGLPPLVPFHINLHVRTSKTNEIARELADHIRDQFARRFRGNDVAYRRAG